MKQFLFLILTFLITCVTLLSSEPVLRLEPASCIAGMRVKLMVVSDESVPEISAVPAVKGLDWGRGSMQSVSENIINGRRKSEYIRVLTFTVQEPGEYVIPSFRVKTDRHAYETKPFHFKAGNAPDLDSVAGEKTDGKAFFAKMELVELPKDSKLYVGQEVTLDFLAFFNMRDSRTIRVSELPVFETGNGVKVHFRDYRKKNPRRYNFESINQEQIKLDGTPYQLMQFRTRFRPLAAGKLTLSSKVTLLISDGRGRGFGFFDFDEPDEYMLHAALPDREVLPLPPPPDQTPAYIDLIGDWTLEGALSEAPYKTGDPLTLKITLRGDGTAETLHPPRLDLPGFRTYPAEIRQSDDGTTLLSYTLIPIRDGTLNIRFAASTFHVSSGTYKPFVFERDIAVEKTSALLPSAPRTYVDNSSPAEGSPTGESAAKNSRMQEILYPHKDIGNVVLLPLWKNTLVAAGCLLLAGILILLLALFIAVRRAAYDSDPSMMRRRAALKQKKALLRAIRDARPEDLPELSGRLSEYLNSVLDLPPGAGLSEAAGSFNEAKTADLEQALKTLANAAWMPDLAHTFTEKMKHDLLKGLSKYTGILLVLSGLFFSLPLAGGEIRTSGEALATYDKGEFKEALAFYQNELKKQPHAVSPSLLYNMGSCYYQLGDLARASVCCERALRLAPRDSDILQNLNLIRRKLMLKEKYCIETPADCLPWIRDVLRADEWIFAAAAALCLCFIGLALRALRKKSWKAVLGTGLLLFFCTVMALIFQYSYVYDSSSAIVVRRNTPVYSLPSEKTGKVGSHLKEGTEVRVEETRSDWARIRFADEEEGWVRSSSLIPVWNETMNDLIEP